MERLPSLGAVVAAMTAVCAFGSLPSSAANAHSHAASAAPPASGQWHLAFDDELEGTNAGLDQVVALPRRRHRRVAAALGRLARRSGDLVITAQAVEGQVTSGETERRRLTWPVSGRWPLDGENDIYATQIGGGHKPFRTFIHYGAGNRFRYYTQDVDSSRWRVVGVEWDPRQLTIYRDGVAVWRSTDRDAIARVPHRLCIQLDATSDGSLSAPVHLYVDFARIWRMPGSPR